MSNSRKSTANFPVGSIVKILPISKTYCERSSVQWDPSMEERIDTVGKVIEIQGFKIEVEFDDGYSFWYTPGCLELESIETQDNVTNEECYHIGQIFKHKSGEHYLLSAVDYDGETKVALVCLNDGERWSDPEYICDPNEISDDEMFLIADASFNEFALVYESYADLISGKEIKPGRLVVFESTSTKRYKTAAEFEKATGHKFIRFAK